MRLDSSVYSYTAEMISLPLSSCGKDLDSSPNTMLLRTLRELQLLLLGPDTDGLLEAEQQEAPPHVQEQAAGPQQLLERLIQATLQSPADALAAFHPTTGAPHAYQLLLSCLQDGHLAAAQLLLLQQLLHGIQHHQDLLPQQQQQQQQKQKESISTQVAGTGGTDTAEANHSTTTAAATAAAGPIIWPNFVLQRLAGLATSVQKAEPNVAVAALRLLATAAAAASGNPSAAFLIPLRAAAAAAHENERQHGESRSQLVGVQWLENLGPAGIAALANMTTSCAHITTASSMNPNASSSSSSTADLLPIPVAGGLLLQLFGCIKHPHAPAAPAAVRPGGSSLSMLLPTAAALQLQQDTATTTSSSSSSTCDSHTPWLLHQLQLLAADDNAHQSAACAAPCSSCSTCCHAGFVVLQNLVAMVLQWPTGISLATSKEFVKGVISLVEQLIKTSPQKTARKLDWCGKHTGFKLAAAAAAPCKTSGNLCHTTKKPCTNVSAEQLVLPNTLLSCADIPAQPNTAAAAAVRGMITSCPVWSCRSAVLQTTWLTQHNITPPKTLLEASLQLLLAVATTGGRRAAAVLYSSDVSNVLDQLREFCTPEVLLLVEKLYSQICLYSFHLWDEVLQDGNVTALTGILAEAAAAAGASGSDLPGRDLQQLRLQLAAISKLSAVLDSAPAADLLHFTGALPAAAQPGGVIQAAARTGAQNQITPAAAAAATRSDDLTGHIAHVVRSNLAGVSRCGLAAVVLLMTCDGHQSLKGSACQLYLAVLSRCRLMQQLSTQQQPKGGLWSQLGRRVLKQLETLVLNPASLTAEAGSIDAMCSAGSSSSTSAAVDINSSSSGSSSTASGAMHAGRSTAQASGKRRAGVAKPSAADTGSNAVAQACNATAYDEDGLRVVWDNAPSAATVAARTAWKGITLDQLLTWSQSSMDLDVRLLLPAGTRKEDVMVRIRPDRLTVSLGWYGRVIDGPFKQRVKASEACWSLDKVTVDLDKPRFRPSTVGSGSSDASSAAAAGGGSGGGGGGGGGVKAVAAGRGTVDCVELLVLLPKENGGHYWRALFEGGAERSHLEILAEAVSNEDDARSAPTVDQLGPEAAAIYEELRERQALMVSGQWDIERSFDDFRLVLGDATL